MNIRFALPLALLMGAAFLPSCGEQAAEAKDHAKGLVEQAKEMSPAKVTETITKITSGLNGVTDLESAKKAAADLMPNLDILATAKKALGDKMPDLGNLSKIVDTVKAKFAGQAGVLDALKPIFDKLMPLMGK
jgi:hypothetical protein